MNREFFGVFIQSDLKSPVHRHQVVTGLQRRITTKTWSFDRTSHRETLPACRLTAYVCEITALDEVAHQFCQWFVRGFVHGENNVSSLPFRPMPHITIFDVLKLSHNRSGFNQLQSNENSLTNAKNSVSHPELMPADLGVLRILFAINLLASSIHLLTIFRQ